MLVENLPQSNNPNEYDRALIRSLRKKLHIKTMENIQLKEENEKLLSDLVIAKQRHRSIKHYNKRKRQVTDDSYKPLKPYNPDDWT